MLRLLERWNSRDAEHVVVEAQNRAGGRPGNSCGDGYSCSREADKRDWQRELHDESLYWSHRLTFVMRHDECRDQYGRGEQRAAWRCAVVCRPDHVVHGKRLESQMLYEAGVRRRGDFSFRCVSGRTMQG